jgi:hypothetical protein
VKRDFITRLVIHGDRANKLVTRAPDGTITKSGAVEGGRYTAKVVPAPTPEAFVEHLRWAAASPRHTLALGFFPDMVGGEEFEIWSKGRVCRAKGLNPATMTEAERERHSTGRHEFGGVTVYTRTKRNMVLSSWAMLDRDLVRDMPQELADLDLDGWLADEAVLLPGLEQCAAVLNPSTSGRVLVDGKPWSSKASWHLFIQVSDPDDFRARVWPAIPVKAFGEVDQASGVPLGFMRHSYSRKDPSVRTTVNGTPWTIHDPTTLSPERLVYDGAPTIVGKGLTLAPPAARIVRQGGRLDVAAIPDPPRVAVRAAAAQGVRVKVARDAKGRVSVERTYADTLRLDLEVDLGGGNFTTIRQLWLDCAGKTRIQSPYRDSDSMAAFVAFKERDGSPFMFDSGSGIVYRLHPADRAGPPPEAFLAALEAWVARQGGKIGPLLVEQASARVRNVIRAAARHGWEQSAIEVLVEKLADTMREPYGMARSTLVRMFRRDGTKAAKAAAAAMAMADDGGDDADDASLLDEMNAKYAVVTIGGSTRVAKVGEHDPCLNRKYIRVMGVGDFQIAYMNVLVPAPTASSPGRMIPLGQWWLQHPERRQHLGGITLDTTGKLGPEHLNTWQGFGVQPCEGDPTPLLEHVAMITAGNGPDAERYLLRWMATKVQNPGDQVEVATVMRGDEGTGKGAIGHAMRRIFGGHGLHVSQPEHLVGKFNFHLMDCLLLFADEAFFAGDPRQVNVLKSLITEHTITIEKKYVDAHQNRNRLGIVMASNADFVVPAGKDARRFFCVDVPDTRKGDREYFNRLWAAIDDPAQLGAFLRHLLDLDLAGFNVRDFPRTEMLEDQKLASLDQHAKWLLNRLVFGTMSQLGEPIWRNVGKDKIIVGHAWPDWASTEQLYADYSTEIRSNGQPRFMLDAASFGRMLSRYFKPSRPGSHRGCGRTRGYALGDLESARKSFAAFHGLGGNVWGAGDDDDQ